MSVTDILKKHAADYGIEISDSLSSKLEIYARELREWNDKINLTAILDDEGIALKHFLDCLLVSKYAEFKAGDKIIDVGTGAGFPGLVIAAAYPDARVTLLDSTGKKLTAVQNIAEAMGVTNVQIVHMRAEDAGKKPEFREQYDYSTARAVAELRILMEWCVPFIKKDGIFLSLKGKNAETELENAENAMKKLYCPLTIDEKVTLLEDGEETSERHNFVFKKAKNTDKIYPRRNAQITKNPL